MSTCRCGATFQPKCRTHIYCCPRCRVSAETSRVRSDVVYQRKLRDNCKLAPGDSPRKQARALYAQGKSVLVISGLTGLSRLALSTLLGVPRPPTEDGCTITGQDGRTSDRERTPALWGTDTVFDGPIKPRTYRVLHDAELDRIGTAGPGEYAVGSEWLTTHDLGHAMNNCHGKSSVVVDERGLVLAKGVKHFYRKDKYQ